MPLKVSSILTKYLNRQNYKEPIMKSRFSHAKVDTQRQDKERLAQQKPQQKAQQKKSEKKQQESHLEEHAEEEE